MAKKFKEQIKQRIKKKRGKYERERKKKFQYLKHTGQMFNYYKKKIPMMPKLKSIIGNLKWWQRIYVALVLGLKRLWRKLFGKQKKES